MMAASTAVVACDFKLEGTCTSAAFAQWRVDLGSVLIDLDAIGQHNVNFLTNVPAFLNDVCNVAAMSARHDNDYWLIYKLVYELHLSKSMVHQCLFDHNFINVANLTVSVNGSKVREEH